MRKLESNVGMGTPMSRIKRLPERRTAAAREKLMEAMAALQCILCTDYSSSAGTSCLQTWRGVWLIYQAEKVSPSPDTNHSPDLRLIRERLPLPNFKIFYFSSLFVKVVDGLVQRHSHMDAITKIARVIQER